MPTKTFFYSNDRVTRSRGRKRSKAGGASHSRSAPHLKQPTPSQVGTEPCPLCGFPVEPRRMHFHMVRVHGAIFRHKGG